MGRASPLQLHGLPRPRGSLQGPGFSQGEGGAALEPSQREMRAPAEQSQAWQAGDSLVRLIGKESLDWHPDVGKQAGL